MSQFPLNNCSNCGGEVSRKMISRDFNREGTTVTIDGIRAIVCNECGEVYFEPEAAQSLLDAANALFQLSRRNRQHKGTLVGVTG